LYNTVHYGPVSCWLARHSERDRDRRVAEDDVIEEVALTRAVAVLELDSML
jgi:hypothetical protein